MLKKIRSAYIAKIIFSLTTKKKKLNIVKYIANFPEKN